LGRLVGAPENLQQYLEGFKKEDIEANPEAVLMAADRARQMLFRIENCSSFFSRRSFKVLRNCEENRLWWFRQSLLG